MNPIFTGIFVEMARMSSVNQKMKKKMILTRTAADPKFQTHSTFKIAKWSTGKVWALWGVRGRRNERRNYDPWYNLHNYDCRDWVTKREGLECGMNPSWQQPPFGSNTQFFHRLSRWRQLQNIRRLTKFTLWVYLSSKICRHAIVENKNCYPQQ